jgi:hypothetical protein
MNNPWMIHLEKTKKKYPQLSLKEAMIMAKRNYKPKKKKGKGVYQDTMNSINKVFCPATKTLKDGEYHLPCSNYTGPGTDISNTNIPPMNATDACSRIHDIEYSKAKTPYERWESDEKVKRCFSDAIKEDPILGRLGYYGISGKNMVEKSMPSVAKAIDPKRYAQPKNGGGIAKRTLLKSLKT